MCSSPPKEWPGKTHKQNFGTHPVPGQSRKSVYVYVFFWQILHKFLTPDWNPQKQSLGQILDKFGVRGVFECCKGKKGFARLDSVYVLDTKRKEHTRRGSFSPKQCSSALEAPSKDPPSENPVLRTLCPSRIPCKTASKNLLTTCFQTSIK